MSPTELLLIFWMGLALVGWWNALKWKKRAFKLDATTYGAGYMQSLMDRGHTKGEALRATLKHLRDNAER